jgi:hypothetical protein
MARAKLSAVFFVLALAGCNIGNLSFFQGAKVADSISGTLNASASVTTGGVPTPAPTATVAPVPTAPGLSKEDVEDALRKALPTAAPTPVPTPTATPTPVPTATPPPGERLREGAWVRARVAGDPTTGDKEVAGRRARIRLTPWKGGVGALFFERVECLENICRKMPIFFYFIILSIMP